MTRITRSISRPSRRSDCVPGVAIGGVVKDEAGAPVAGARITVHAPPTETEESNYGFTSPRPRPTPRADGGSTTHPPTWSA